MLKGDDPRQLAVDLLPRSICTVQVGCALTDAGGSIIAWGWNGVGTGLGKCAERHAIERANRRRLFFGHIYVASQWRNRDKFAPAKPCKACKHIIDKYNLEVHWRDKEGRWR